MSATPTFAHVVFQTSNLPQMRDWYCTVLDAHVVFEGHGLCFLTFDEEHHRIALLGVPVELTRKSPTAAGMHHSAYTFATLDDLLERYEELETVGIAPLVPIQHGVTTSLYYQDPDENLVELQIDNFATPEDATDYMRGVEYAENPVGVGFDPRLMRQALRLGVPVEEIITRQWALGSCPDQPDPMAALAGA